MNKAINYRTLGMALRVIADACMEADRQQRNGEKVTACGMSDEELTNLCERIPYLMNPLMSTEDVKDKLQVSDATLNRMVARGDIPNGQSKKHGTTRYWKKWDILHYLRNRKKK